VAAPWVPDAFRSLRHRNYQLLWMGSLVSNSGDWMDQIALNWLVYQLTDSPIALGVLNFCRLAPIFVFTLLGGVVADRVERRSLLFTTQTVAMVLAFVLAALVSTGLVQFWMVLVIAVGRGVTMSFNQPARQSLISELVPREDLRNAIALNSATLNLTRVIGPTIGGLLIATVGVAGAFYFNAISFLAVLISLMMMRFSDRARRVRGSVLGELVGGLTYLRSQPTLFTLVMLAMVPMIFGMPYMTMLTVFASDVLKVGGGGLGILTACSGLGALTGALFVAATDNFRIRMVLLMMLGLVSFGVMLAVFALSPWLPLSAIALVLVGFSQQIYMATNNTLIQTHVAEEYRGRVLSTLFLNRSMVPLGTILAGIGTALVGAPATVAAMGLVLVLLAAGVGRFAPMKLEEE
jgi:MFS family permease